jgi:hypothetical protein
MVDPSRIRSRLDDFGYFSRDVARLALEET